MQTLRNRFVNSVRRFNDDERGVGSTFAIFMAIICITVGGLAIDVSNAWQARQHLQTTADVAAHAGALQIAYPDVSGVKTPVNEALAIAAINMPNARFGDVLVNADIVVGHWDTATRTMSVASGVIPNAVQVTTRRDNANGNPVGTFLLKLIGFSHWQISTVAVAAVAVGDCHRDGLVAGGIVDLTSGNSFYNGMCIHGQLGVQMSSNNFFDYQDGVRISMPDPRPDDDGGMFVERSNNVGAQESLREANIYPLLSTEEAIKALIADLSIPSYADRPIYINNPTVNLVTLSASFDVDLIVPNAVNIFTCDKGSASKISIPGGTTIENVIIIADCPFEFGQNSSIENGVFMTTSTDANSIKGANNVRLGYVDDCVPGGGAQFVTLGGVDFASAIEYHGSQVIAAGDVKLAAGVNGLSGISVQAGGDITVTAGNSMGVCSGGVDTIADQYVVRLVY